MTIMDAATFRQLLPEFSDSTRYPDGAVSFWAGLAGSLLPPDRWEDLLQQGTAFYIAHHLAMAEGDMVAASAGGIPGQVKGPLTGRSVDKVSSSYDSGAVSLDGAGFWNLTTYGIRFLTLARCIGAGGIQL
ncbi:DUF4054 domain-containing protein [Chromobacterium subtsugae]|uniref:DUF4054 domain-containing protein n=1 Tax=Chromobacterium subtsugae TaxID=251747 RepID=UPI000A921C82|nr:DUF4054 domain-containing protein [Chromobacterium subtsugae]